VRKKKKYAGGSVLLHRMEFLKVRTFMWWNMAEFSSLHFLRAAQTLHWPAEYSSFSLTDSTTFLQFMFVEIP
jgi:hypothetical protein